MIHKITIFLLALCLYNTSSAQTDTTNHKIDSFLLNRKGFFGKLGRSIVVTQNGEIKGPVKNDLVFKRFEGKVIRKIFITNAPFGKPLNDSARGLTNMFTNLANSLHTQTRRYVILNNLFFKPGDSLDAYTMADNERHLRDLDILQDAAIKVFRIPGSQDSIDILVATKDVLSIGGSLDVNNSNRITFSAFESNLGGTGNEFLIRNIVDRERKPSYAPGAEFTFRNIAGSFIDTKVGFSSFANSFTTGLKHELTYYTQVLRPFVFYKNRFTYAAEYSYHTIENSYLNDSVYKAKEAYTYTLQDAWVGWNTGAFKLYSKNENNRIRTLLSGRITRLQYTQVPDAYRLKYDYRFADVTGAYIALSVFGQDFYKTNYIYGFGRTEDIPEGIDVNLTGGWEKRAGDKRLYAGLDINRYYLDRKDNYIRFFLKTGGYHFQNRWEDVNFLAGGEYISRLTNLKGKWKVRSFISASYGKQINPRLNAPLFLQSQFGLNEFRSDTMIYGNTRITAKAETVFFNGFNFLNFRLAPFATANLCILNPDIKIPGRQTFYKTIGGGLRMRNESLIFETTEARAYYSPDAFSNGKHWSFVVNSNLRFKYNRQLIRKPDVAVVN
ncbi:MAG: hypothetical protein HYR66_02600 [Sphingobacteriales bacterium]|nr:hypothetical protein [Sphingobacteriales bacterium]MBI3718643.1 hypothetical protein [Sphingobacteriales bacterium]